MRRLVFLMKLFKVRGVFNFGTQIGLFGIWQILILVLLSALSDRTAKVGTNVHFCFKSAEVAHLHLAERKVFPSLYEASWATNA